MEHHESVSQSLTGSGSLQVTCNASYQAVLRMQHEVREIPGIRDSINKDVAKDVYGICVNNTNYGSGTGVLQGQACF